MNLGKRRRPAPRRAAPQPDGKMLNRVRGLVSSVAYGPGYSADDPRKRLSAQFIRGSGIEIGALHNALWTPRRAGVTYVDRLDVEGLRRHYPELNHLPLARVEVIDDGETLKSFAANSQDFI